MIVKSLGFAPSKPTATVPFTGAPVCEFTIVPEMEVALSPLPPVVPPVLPPEVPLPPLLLPDPVGEPDGVADTDDGLVAEFVVDGLVPPQPLSNKPEPTSAMTDR
jgi:hypothetical protein